MTQYIVKRVLLVFPTLFLLTVIVFLMVALIPGDVVDAAARRGTARGEQTKEELRAALGLDRPLHLQYLGWLVGQFRSRGTVFRTTNGGKTWEPALTGPLFLFNDVAFVDKREGWAVAQDGGVFHTTNRGKVWERQRRKTGQPLLGIAFLDKHRGWAVGAGGTITYTADGGETWQVYPLGLKATLRDIFFADARNGWIVGDEGTVLRTTDGGVSWRAADPATEADLVSVFFVDPSNGWAVGRKGVVLHSRDGGASWQALDIAGGQDLNQVFFADARNGWIVGEGGLILHTADGGASWARVDSPTEAGVTAVFFADARRGWVFDGKGRFFSTFDGGQTWEEGRIASLNPVPRPVKAAAFASKDIGWAVGWDRKWEWGVLGGNLGKSLTSARTTAWELKHRFPASLQLAIMAMLLALLGAVPIGILAAVRQDTLGDYIGRSIAILGLAMPSFWVATLVILIPAVLFHWTPPLEYVPFTENPLKNLAFFALPAAVVAFPQMATIMRMTRAMMLEVLRQDYIRTAWSKGLTEAGVVVRHALKNAMIPVVTLVGLLLPFVLAESVLIEVIFNIPGVGRLAWNTVQQRDFPLLQGIILVTGSVVVLLNLVVDLLYSWLDPRIRYQ